MIKEVYTPDMRMHFYNVCIVQARYRDVRMCIQVLLKREHILVIRTLSMVPATYIDNVYKTTPEMYYRGPPPTYNVLLAKGTI